MNYKNGIITCIVLALVPVVLWLATGSHFATRYECKSSICETKTDCMCTKENGCLDYDGDDEEQSLDCKSRKLCYRHQDQTFKPTSCQAASDCIDDEYKTESDWDCRDGKQCYDTEFGDYIKDAEAPLLPCFQFGLTPSGLIDGVLPSSGAFMGLAVLLFILRRRRQQ
jgi:hypothetical protein